MKRRILGGVAAGVVGLVLLAGCGEGTPGEDDNGKVERQTGVVDVQTPDGRTVQCAVWNSYRSGGIDCDWEHAK